MLRFYLFYPNHDKSPQPYKRSPPVAATALQDQWDSQAMLATLLGKLNKMTKSALVQHMAGLPEGTIKRTRGSKDGHKNVKLDAMPDGWPPRNNRT